MDGQKLCMLGITGESHAHLLFCLVLSCLVATPSLSSNLCHTVTPHFSLSLSSGPANGIIVNEK